MGQARIELAKPKATDLQSVGFTTYPIDPRGLIAKTKKPQNLPQEDDQSSCSDSERRFTDLRFWYGLTVHHAVSIPGDDGASPVDRSKIWFVWWGQKLGLSSFGRSRATATPQVSLPKAP